MIFVLFFLEQGDVSDDDESSSVGLAVGIPILVCFIVIGLGVAFKIWISKRKSTCDMEDVGNERMSREEPEGQNRRLLFADVMSGSIKQPTIEEFDDLVSFKDDDLGQRFTRFQGNRFNNIGSLNLVPSVLPFDHNRVLLKNLIGGYDYVNASVMFEPTLTSEDQTYDEVIYSSTISFSKIKIIVGQDPKPSTFPHHWSLVHENKVDFVVNFTTRLLKPGKVYRFGDVSVRVLDHERMSAMFSRKEIRLFNVSTAEFQYTHKCKIYHIEGWPDEEKIEVDHVYDIVLSVVLLRKEMKLEMEKATLMLHDKEGGIGSSAVILTLMQLFEQVDNNLNDENAVKNSDEKLNVFDTVNKLRMGRAGMVSSFKAYKLIYQCLKHYGHQRLAFQKIKSDIPTKKRVSECTPNKMASDFKPKPSPKPRIAPKMKRETLNAEIGEEYAHIYDEAKKEDMEPIIAVEYADIYDEYLMPDE